MVNELEFPYTFPINFLITPGLYLICELSLKPELDLTIKLEQE